MKEDSAPFRDAFSDEVIRLYRHLFELNSSINGVYGPQHEARWDRA